MTHESHDVVPALSDSVSLIYGEEAGERERKHIRYRLRWQQ